MASLSLFWNNAQYSDVKLQLRTVVTVQLGSASGADDLPAASGGAAKVARRSSSSSGGGTAPEAARNAVHAGSRTYHLHGVLLAGASSHFRSSIPLRTAAGASWRRQRRIAAGGSAATQTTERGLSNKPLLMVEHVEECELDAMEAVLRHCYTGRLCEEGAVRPSAVMLLRMMTLSNRFDMSSCLTESCDALASLPLDAYNVPAINAVLADLTSGWHALPAFPRVTAAASDGLLALLGDADAVVRAAGSDGSSLDSLLQQLSLDSLLVLLTSTELSACSENSVLLMADTWMAGAAGAACDAAARRRVVACLHLCRLSHSFFFDVLPALRWVKLSKAEKRCLSRFVAAGEESDGGDSDTRPARHGSWRQEHLFRTGHHVGPDAWYFTPPESRTRPQPLLMQWKLTWSQLATCMGRSPVKTAGDRPDETSPWYYFCGFTLRLVLGVSPRGESGPGRAFVALEAQVATAGRGGAAGAIVPCSAICVRADMSVQGVHSAHLHETCAGFLPGSDLQLDIGTNWDACLVRGLLHVECSVFQCD